MPNRNYRNGSALERRICNYLAERGYEAIRGAGSKSYGRIKIDIIAISNTEVLVIQVKNQKLGPKAKQKLSLSLQPLAGTKTLKTLVLTKKWRAELNSS